jgi:UDP-N-acetylglucosamine 2-epimerase (non-hydrolysing)
MTETHMIPVAQRRDMPARKMTLVSVHRRENHGPRGLQIGEALQRLAQDRPDAEVVFVGHTHPALAPIAEFLRAGGLVRVLPPQDYPDWLGLLCECRFVISDSGGAQEEAPWIGKPVLVLRDETERPEVVETGAARLVGTDPDTIYRAAIEFLDDPLVDQRMQIARQCYPYGNGIAAAQIASHVVEFLRTGNGSRDGADRSSHFRMHQQFVEIAATMTQPVSEPQHVNV